MRKSLVAVVVLALAVVTGAVAADVRPDQRSPLAQAIGSVPRETGTASFTDWSRVRAELGHGLDRGSRRSVDGFLSRVYSHDLMSVSVIGAVQRPMAEKLGWSVLDLQWEMYSQSRKGAVLVLALSESTDGGEVADGLRDVGYTAPSSGGTDGGVWRTNDEVSANVSGLPAQLANVAVLEDRGLVVASDRRAYAERTVGIVEGRRSSFADTRAARDLAGVVSEPDVAVLRDPRAGCDSTSYADAAPVDRERATEVVGDSLVRHRGLVLAVRERDGAQRMRVGMRFDSTSTAQRQLDVRRGLAAGEAIGQGGTFAERFEISDASTERGIGVLDLRLRSVRTEALSDLGQGALLFAWCGPATTGK